jgi:(p)ppGpp synthase/HD superfamily hydrolase
MMGYEKARLFAKAAHAAVGQMRKYTGEPYIVHPVEVAGIVRNWGGTDTMCVAALLHDVLEDTKITYDILEDEFGVEVAQLVRWLTDVSRPSDGNRATRKALDRQHIADAPAEAQTIKVADMISNTKSIVSNDPDFAVVYLKEKKELLRVLTKVDSHMIAHAWDMVEEAERDIHFANLPVSETRES